MDTRSEEAVSPWQWTLGTLQPKATKRLARGPRTLREPGGPPWGPRRERGSATPGLSAFGTGDGSISVASRPAWGHWSRQPQVTDIASPVCQELPGCQAHSEHFTRRADSMLMSSKWHVQGRQGLRAPWKVTWEAPGPLSWHTPCRRTQLPHFLQWHLRRRANSAWMEPSVLDGGLRLPGVPKAAPTAPDPCLCIRGHSTALGPGESCVAIRLPGVLCERNSPPLPEPLPGGRPHSPRWPASP